MQADPHVLMLDQLLRELLSTALIAVVAYVVVAVLNRVFPFAHKRK